MLLKCYPNQCLSLCPSSTPPLTRWCILAISSLVCAFPATTHCPLLQVDWFFLPLHYLFLTSGPASEPYWIKYIFLSPAFSPHGQRALASFSVFPSARVPCAPCSILPVELAAPLTCHDSLLRAFSCSRLFRILLPSSCPHPSP